RGLAPPAPHQAAGSAAAPRPRRSPRQRPVDSPPHFAARSHRSPVGGWPNPSCGWAPTGAPGLAAHDRRSTMPARPAVHAPLLRRDAENP
ncbi:hypothetical protein ACFV47_27900, partial [Streptomyces solisilvae]